MTDTLRFTQFDYRLNAMIAALDADSPAQEGYAEKRKALYSYVRDLEAQAAHIKELEAACINALYHHQGASSVVGQPIRKVLGIGQFDRLTDAQIATLKSAMQEGSKR